MTKHGVVKASLHMLKAVPRWPMEGEYSVEIGDENRERKMERKIS